MPQYPGQFFWAVVMEKSFWHDPNGSHQSSAKGK